PTAAAPLVAPVAVEVGAAVLPVLAPALVLAGRDVVGGAVRVGHRHHPDLPAVHGLPHTAVGGVAVGEPLHDVQAHLGGEVLAGVLVADEQHFRLVLVLGRVVADLHQRDVAALVGRADAGLHRDVRVV